MHDRKGNLLVVGDLVTIPAIVESITPGAITCGMMVRTVDKQTPDHSMGDAITLNACMTEKVDVIPPNISLGDAAILQDKILRKKLDEIIQDLRKAFVIRNSRERSLCLTKLQEAVMWLGMDLKDINDSGLAPIANPYPNSKDPSNTKIEPTADGLKL